jgi:hypothetical protein
VRDELPESFDESPIHGKTETQRTNSKLRLYLLDEGERTIELKFSKTFYHVHGNQPSYSQRRFRQFATRIQAITDDVDNYKSGEEGRNSMLLLSYLATRIIQRK